MKMTPRKKQLLNFINSYSQRHGYAPSIPEIAKKLKRAPSTIHQHLEELKIGGHISREKNQPRSFAVAQRDQMISIPLLGTIAAGQPIEAIESTGETIAITKNQVSRNGKHYALRVQGNSMIDEGIFDGDIVVIRKQETADNGQMVVAIIDDNEATLKKLYREKGRFRLQPANPSLFPIYREEVGIRGVVVSIIRNLKSDLDASSVKGRYVRRIDNSWDYRGEKTKRHTHGIHAYPAMFIPQVARRLLETYSQKGDVICDIFCGSGTALVESKLLGRNAYGIDLNPFAIFLAYGKTTPLDPMKLKKEYEGVLAYLKKNKEEVEWPNFKNIDFWFKEIVIKKLAKLKKAIRAVEDKNIQNFLMISFSETVRLASNTKNGEFKLVRIKKDKLEKHDPDVFGIFQKKTENNINGMIEFNKDSDEKVWTKIISGDSSKDNDIKPNSVDFIITSPPYGDSRTTVAYGQFSRLSAQWVNIFENPDDASGVDNTLLGGSTVSSLANSLGSKYLKDSLEKIARRDVKRAKEVLSFNVGLNDCLKQAYTILKPKKYFCLVIGNRMVKQVRIPTDFIIAELAEKIGFTCEDIFVRNIPGKRMPLRNSPTNITGALEETMNSESIVVLRKN